MRNGKPKIIFHVGGHDFHPVYDQLAVLRRWLAPDYLCHMAESLAAFEHLHECDLLVFVGMYFSGWEGRYRSPGDVHKRALERYVSSGKPIISCHGAIASYDDWDRFSQLIGYSFTGSVPRFGPAEKYRCHVVNTEHPIMLGTADYELFDAPPIGVEIDPAMHGEVLANTQWHDRNLPLIVAGDGGRISGSGKSAYIAHGHDLHAFDEHPMRSIWTHAVQWCLAGM